MITKSLRKIELMYRMFGKTEGRCCRECSNLVEGRYHDKILRKCKVYGLTHSEASDWAKRYQACGMYNRPWDKGPIIELVRPSRAEKEEQQQIPLEGQLSLEV